jgi:hypothetical protein
MQDWLQPGALLVFSNLSIFGTAVSISVDLGLLISGANI